jgi:hypothetical protein
MREPANPPQCHVGSGLPACRWASARRGAGELEFLGQRGEPCFDRIPVDVVLNSRGFFVVTDEVVVAFVLPEGAGMKAKHTDGLVPGEAFERAKPFSGRHVRRDQKMNVIRHDDECVQLVASESTFAVVEGIDHYFGYFPLPEKHGAGLGVIEQVIHGEESFSGCEVGGPKDAAPRKAAVQAEGHEYSFADDIPMRESPLIPAHVVCSSGGGAIVSRDFVSGCTGRSPAAGPKPCPTVIQVDG